MSILRKYEKLNEECVYALPSDGDDLIRMPLCGISRCLPDYRITREVSPECVLEYVISGSGTYRTENLEFHPGAGDVYLIHFGSTHEYFTDPENPWTKIWFNLRGSLAENLFRLYGLEKTWYIPESGLRSVFEEELARMRTHLEDAQEAAVLAVNRLMFRISRRIRTAEPVPPAAAEIRKYLNGNPAIRFSREVLEKISGYSASRASSLFRSAYGVTPNRYFAERKLEIAKIMLENTEKSVKEIAAELNFADEFYFSNRFKLRYGTSPRGLRRKRG